MLATQQMRENDTAQPAEQSHEHVRWLSSSSSSSSHSTSRPRRRSNQAPPPFEFKAPHLQNAARKQVAMQAQRPPLLPYQSAPSSPQTSPRSSQINLHQHSAATSPRLSSAAPLSKLSSPKSSPSLPLAVPSASNGRRSSPLAPPPAPRTPQRRSSPLAGPAVSGRDALASVQEDEDVQEKPRYRPSRISSEVDIRRAESPSVSMSTASLSTISLANSLADASASSSGAEVPTPPSPSRSFRSFAWASRRHASDSEASTHATTPEELFPSASASKPSLPSPNAEASPGATPINAPFPVLTLPKKIVPPSSASSSQVVVHSPQPRQHVHTQAATTKSDLPPLVVSSEPLEQYTPSARTARPISMSMSSGPSSPPQPSSPKAYHTTNSAPSNPRKSTSGDSHRMPSFEFAPPPPLSFLLSEPPPPPSKDTPRLPSLDLGKGSLNMTIQEKRNSEDRTARPSDSTVPSTARKPSAGNEVRHSQLGLPPGLASDDTPSTKSISKRPSFLRPSGFASAPGTRRFSSFIMGHKSEVDLQAAAVSKSAVDVAVHDEAEGEKEKEEDDTTSKRTSKSGKGKGFGFLRALKIRR